MKKTPKKTNTDSCSFQSVNPHYILEELSFKYFRLCDLNIPRGKWLNYGDSDQLLHSAVSDLGLHRLPFALFEVSD